MPKQTRNTLRQFFGKGQLPTQETFADLIDSTLNMADEGFSKSTEHGFELSTLDGSQSLMSFFRDGQPKPLWTFGYIGRSDGFSVNYKPNGDDAKPVLNVLSSQRVGVNTQTPVADLDVCGFVASDGRIGRSPMVDDLGQGELVAYADGEWHNITETLTGCHAFEIVAGVVASEANKSHGQYALAHAIAMNAYHPTGWLSNPFGFKNRIRCQHAFYRSLAYRLKFRWKTVGNANEHRYQLQVRSNIQFGSRLKGKKLIIQYHITKLWSDSLNRIAFAQEGE